MIQRVSLCGFVASVLCTASFVDAVEPLYPQRTSTARAAELKSTPWIDVIAKEIPPMKKDLGDRLPMIMWHGVGFDPLTPDQISVLRDRGLTQHLQMDAAMIPAALKLQQAGMPVILMQGRTDNWPYSLDEDPQGWAHQFDATFQPKGFGNEDAFEWHGACPGHTAGWKVLAKQTRETMEKFRAAGVKVTGVWMDFEGDPYPWSHLFDQLKHCHRCRSELPEQILNNKAAWRDDAWRRYVALYDEHFAKPIREVFPDCLVTNWHVVVSTPENPVRYFVREVNLPELSAVHFNATNPIAYGTDVVWHELYRGDPPLTQHQVNDFYAVEMLQQVKTDHANRRANSQRKLTAVPWVARHCRIDTQDRRAPMMTRERYRQALGEVWQEGIATMQVFNAMHDGYEELAIIELQDAVIAFEESL
ncbi:MAG: hypothetical protein WBD20_07490 [Pirellulaceae bacterium]